MAKKKLTYEQSISRIEEIAAALEESTVPLEDAVSYYKEGMELVLWCQKALDGAEEKIMQFFVGSKPHPWWKNGRSHGFCLCAGNDSYLFFDS